MNKDKILNTIQIELPEDIESSLSAIQEKREYFIIDAIKEKLNRLNEEKFEALLIEGYKNNQFEDLHITKEFEPVDFQE
jgi:hypothetical protein